MLQAKTPTPPQGAPVALVRVAGARLFWFVL